MNSALKPVASVRGDSDTTCAKCAEQPAAQIILLALIAANVLPYLSVRLTDLQRKHCKKGLLRRIYSLVANSDRTVAATRESDKTCKREYTVSFRTVFDFSIRFRVLRADENATFNWGDQ